ncbi:hypothetical protein Tco_0026635 [Tanacetum coccineum]
MIDERACHEEELRITEKDVKDKQEKLEMEKQETMIQKSECSSPRDNSDAKREKQEMKENYSKTFQELKKVVLVLNLRVLFANENEFAFEAKGPDIRLSNDIKPLHEVQSTVVYNMNANDRQHAEQLKFINEGKVDQDVEQCLDNKITESLNQTLVFENDCLKKTIAKLQNDFSKLEAQRIAYEIALQHKLKLTTLSWNIESNQCDEVKVKVNFDEIETNNTELEHRVSSLLKENEHLKLVYKNLFDSIKKTHDQKENLRATLSEFSVNHIFGKEDSSPSSTNELEKESGENICDNAKCEFQTKFVEIEKVLTQQTKDFDDVKLELSNITTKFEAYFEKLEKTKVFLNDNWLKGKHVETKLDNSSILGKPPLLNSERDQLLR